MVMSMQASLAEQLPGFWSPIGIMASAARLVVGAALVCAVGPLAAQAPPPATRQTVSGASITGLVVDAATRKPVGGAVVMLISVPRASVRVFPVTESMYEAIGTPSPSVMTGADGRFRFDDVTPDHYEIRCTKPGWQSDLWESADFNMNAPWLTVQPSARGAVTIPLRRAPAIEGYVVDEQSRPVIGMEVGMFQPRPVAGHRRWQMYWSRKSDDGGRFRLGGLPGDVAVGAMPSTLFTRFDSLEPVVGGARPLVYVPTLFPAATSLSDATLLRMMPGDERTGLEIRMTAVPAFKVRGVITGFREAARLSMTLRSDNQAALNHQGQGFRASVDAQGRVTWPLIPPGRYLLRAIEPPKMAQMSHGIAPLTELPPEPTMWLETTVEVVDRDIDLNLSLQPGVRISGRVEFEGDVLPATIDTLRKTAIVIVRADGESNDLRGLFLDGKTFTSIQIPAGRYLMRTAAPRGWFLKSITHEGRRISDEPFDVGTGDIDGVVITFTQRPSSLAGSVTVEPGIRQRPWVLAFPDDRRLWSDYGTDPRRIGVARLGSSLTYELQLPAGGYYVAALGENPELLEPATFEALVASATQVFVAENERRVQPLTARQTNVRR